MANMIYVIIGVSGSGKTTIGKLLSETLSIPFYDADWFHPRENITKMKSSIPLSDEDRMPWLENIASHALQWQTTGDCVLACSALKEKYRHILSVSIKTKLTFIHLMGDIHLIHNRLSLREDHFFPANLLKDQFSILEVPQDAIHININQTPNAICREIIGKL